MHYTENDLMNQKQAVKEGAIAQAGSDPWKHRSDGMKCTTCMWFVAKEPCTLSARSFGIGRCRRHAPSMNGYPVVFVNDWCGDHKLDETKI